jgi:hypothetical protein
MHGHWVYWFFEETYRENIHLIWPVNEQQRRAFLMRHLGVSEGEFAKETTTGKEWTGKVTELLPEHNGGGGGQLISFERFANDTQSNAILAHEAFHCAANILSQRGVDYDDSTNGTNEAYAYLIQRIVATCHQAMSMVPKRG